ncbi:MAG: hypothetical protein R3F38_19955 [Gammaproteobacteria bacterium]
MNYTSLMNDHRLGRREPIYTMNQLIDSYLLKVTPKKAESSHRREIGRAVFLKRVFGEMHPAAVTTLDVYAFIDWRTDTAPVGVNRELALLSSIFQKGIRWGALTSSPMIDIERNPESPRDRYITHEEYTNFRQYAFERNPVIAWYMDFKYLCGLRTFDIRALKQSQFTDEGIALKISKNQTNRLIAWTPAFRQVTMNLIEACGRERRDEHGTITRLKQSSEHVLFTRDGTPYTADGWRANFYRLMRGALEEGVLLQPFCDHDIRAKAGSDHANVEEARRFLAHLNIKITEKHYRRKAEVIQPLM